MMGGSGMEYRLSFPGHPGSVGQSGLLSISSLKAVMGISRKTENAIIICLMWLIIYVYTRGGLVFDYSDVSIFQTNQAFISLIRRSE